MYSIYVNYVCYIYIYIYIAREFILVGVIVYKLVNKLGQNKLANCDCSVDVYFSI